jgi:uncharacterized protein with PQ loop repeat
VETIGYIAGLLLGWCALPQVIESIKRGNTIGVSKFFLWMWFSGEIGMVIYTLSVIGFDKPLMLNYTLNIVMIGVLFKYSYFPRS